MEKTVSWIKDYTESEMKAVTMFPVEGTYQVRLNFNKTNLTKEELYSTVAEKAKLALKPGNWFDRDSSLLMRMNTASPISKIQSVFNQLNAALG